MHRAHYILHSRASSDPAVKTSTQPTAIQTCGIEGLCGCPATGRNEPARPGRAAEASHAGGGTMPATPDPFMLTGGIVPIGRVTPPRRP